MIVGQTISHYRVLELLGAGGMGEVYKAEDVRLKRTVALKLLPLALTQDAEAKERLVLEAQAASALDHPNICTIHEVDETTDGRVFIAMAYYDGETLRDRIAGGPLAIDEAVELMTHAVRGVAAAHDAGIVHRDIKPANIIVSKRGDVKLLDFGIAKLSGQTALTRTGTTLGTVAYMAPEMIAGQGLDARADVWALGVVLFQMIAGRLPFRGDNDIAILKSIMDGTAPPLHSVRPDVPPAVEAIVARALEKDPARRYETATALLRDLEALRPSPLTQPIATMEPSGRRVTQTVVAGLLVATALLGGWFGYRLWRTRQARQLVPQFVELMQKEQYAAAFRVYQRAAPLLSNDPAFIKARDEYMLPSTIRTEPPGADVYAKGYGETDADWYYLGRSPIEARVPIAGYYRWRITKAGYEPFEGADGTILGRSFILASQGSVPAGMVYVPSSTYGAAGGNERLPAFFIDRYEVTNREFKAFVDAGGYRNRDFWHEPFIKDGREVPWDVAVAGFRDATGRPGPASWELGSYPDGQEDVPVHGISWYEAAAYARFAGKELPTVYHWRRAADFTIYSDILRLSNFGATAPAPVGQFKGLGTFGTYDMAGNVKEWCWNAVGSERYTLGGGFNEPNYLYRGPDARAPFDRSTNLGVRTIKVPDPNAVPRSAFDPIPRLIRDYTFEKPVSDEIFNVYRQLFTYDKADLRPVVDSTSDDRAWRTERVSFAAAYGNERMAAYVILPTNAKPPYQPIVYFPHSGALLQKTFEPAEMSYLGFIVKSGRALIVPIYKGTYDRRATAPSTGPNAVRDVSILQVKDFERTVDYLQTRNDIDVSRLGYFGVSLGSGIAPTILAVEPRIKAAVLWAGGLATVPRPAEIDQINYVTRVRVPLLLMNGRDDFQYPVDAAQLPFMRLLGTPDADKQHKLFDGGHVFPFARIQGDTIAWFDKYFGAPK
ncbi:MAG TPA: protein kinase [Vicinamibacterales bacterium]|nr:protein kinase [Vicinamibacterales bacterium]